MLSIDIHWFWIAPELVLAVTGMVALLAAAFCGRPGTGDVASDGKGVLHPAAWISFLGVAAAGVLALLVGLQGSQAPAQAMTHLWNSMAHDPFSAYFKVAVAVAVLLVMLMTHGYRRAIFNRPELYGLLVFATLATFLMASASELVMIFLSIEFLSLTSYIMAGYLKDDPRSAEAGLKYFLFGATCSAVMLYGMSLLYGMTGATTLSGIATGLSAADAGTMQRQIVVIAILLVMAGLGFKISMVPFQQWVPDVYEGAATPVSAFLSVVSKAAGFALTVRLFTTALGMHALAVHWATIIGILAMVTMTWGNTAAIWQTNMKRMLGYSSVAQAGYIMVGIAAAGLGGEAVRQFALPAVLFYIVAYIFMNLGAFAVVIAVANQDGTEEIPGYAGLSQRAPWLAALLTFFLLSLIGIPPTGGFVAKLYLFLAALRGQSPLLTTIAIVMIINSVISAYYYLNVTRQMYMHAPVDPTPISPNRPMVGALAVTALATLAIFLYAQPFIDLAGVAMPMLPIAMP